MAPKRPYFSTATDSVAATLRGCGNTKKKKGISLSEVGHRLLTSSRADIERSDLIILLNSISPTTSSERGDIIVSIVSLNTFFVFHPPFPTNTAAGEHGVSDSELRTMFHDLFSRLVHLASSSSLCNSDLLVREAVLNAIMEFVRLGMEGSFYHSLYSRLIHDIVNSSLEVDLLLESLASNYFQYIDVCYFTSIALENICNAIEKTHRSGDKVPRQGEDPKPSLKRVIDKIHFILSRIPPPHDSYNDFQVWSKGFLSEEGDKREHMICTDVRAGDKRFSSLSSAPKKIKQKYTKAWMSFLRLPLPNEIYEKVLVNLHQALIPYLSQTEHPIICDFLTRSYDIGGVVGVLALSGIFVLMTKYLLEYPDFYQKLYTLLKPPMFMAKHRAKFLELLDACLKSPLLPGYLAAAFTKKLSRLSLEVPPSGALVIIALVHNLLRRHPSINFLVHQESDAGVASNMASEKQGVDIFDDKECDPLKSNAMRSSLWEIDTLRHHYCPPVSRFALSLENDLTVRAKTTEMAISDFSSASYSTILEEEMRRRVKQVLLAFYKTTPTSVFSESDFPGWTFDCGEFMIF